MSGRAPQELLFKAKKPEEGYNFIAGPGNTDLKLLEFGRIFLPGGSSYHTLTNNREACLTILTGRCSVEVGSLSEGPVSEKSVTYSHIGGRNDVFTENPTMVYIPRNSDYRIKAESGELHAAVFQAPSRRDALPLLVDRTQKDRQSFGAANWRRDASIGLGDTENADRLLVGETYNLPGNWSSYPPHKHDAVNPPEEEPYEEIYFFMLKPSRGFGIQRIYTGRESENPLDEVYVVENGDTTVIPRGYHPVAAAAGYELYYLWALAGEERSFGSWSEDPQHAWIRELERTVNSE